MRLTGEDLLAIGHAYASKIKIKAVFTGVSTDSRSIKKGNLFVAVRGERFDGNRFVGTAFRNGAAAAVVDSSAGMRAAAGRPVVRVGDSVAALGELAGIYRRKFSGPVIAVAGSNGKTTTKELIADVLSRKYRVARSKGNFNNDIGVPLTLFGMKKRHQAAVIEIGTNHFGEVRRLCEVALPTHGLITNTGSEHLEFFGTAEGAARAECELFEYLRGSGGRAFVNADDARIVRLIAGWRAKLRSLRYGFTGARRSVAGEIGSVKHDGRCELRVRAARRRRPAVKALLRSPGREAAANALAAAAVGIEFGVPSASIGKALSAFRPVGKRMEVLKVSGVTIINDTYNANPDSVIAAAGTLMMFRGKGKRIAILGDMLELGKRSQAEHRRVGRELRAMGLKELYTVGAHAKQFGAGGSGSGRSGGGHFNSKRALAAALRPRLVRGDILLVKGSRGMKMEEVTGAVASALKKRRP